MRTTESFGFVNPAVRENIMARVNRMHTRKQHIQGPLNILGLP